MFYCQNCGAQLQDNTTVCPYCGAQIPPVYRQDPQPNYQQPNYQQPNYQQPNYQPVGGGYRANIKKRDIAVCVILSIVTCGIYGLIWFFYLVNDLNVAAQTPSDKTPGTVLLLTIVTCGIYGIVWVYQAGEKVDRIRQMNGEAPSNSALVYLLLSLFGLGIVAYCLIQSELNKVAALQ